jgi:hypothetical protein
MGVLRSPLFVNTPQPTKDKLEACATGKPNEISTHFTIGETGEHVRLVKQALKDYATKHPDEITAPFTVDRTYDKNFAIAIGQFKTTRKPPLTNFAGKIDEIVGIKTIRALDDTAVPGPPAPKPPVPPPPQPVLAKRVNKKAVLLPETPEKDDPPLFTILKTIEASRHPDKQVVDTGSAEIDTSFKVKRIDITLQTGSIPSQQFVFTFGPPSPDDVFIFRGGVSTERVSPTVAQEIYDHPGHFVLRPRKPGTSGFP